MNLAIGSWSRVKEFFYVITSTSPEISKAPSSRDGGTILEGGFQYIRHGVQYSLMHVFHISSILFLEVKWTNPKFHESFYYLE